MTYLYHLHLDIGANAINAHAYREISCPHTILKLESFTDLSVLLSWTSINNICMPISSYNIYQNDKLVKSVPYTENTATIDISSGVYTFYVKSLSTTIESDASNTVTNS